MSEILSWEEMSQRFYGEWLLIVDAELDEFMGVLRGEVLAHSPNQGDIYDVLHLRRGRSASIEYVGEAPDDLGFVLGATIAPRSAVFDFGQLVF